MVPAGLSCHQASLLVPRLCIHDLIDDVCLRLHNAVNDAVLNRILGLHVQWPLHVLWQHVTLSQAVHTC